MTRQKKNKVRVEGEPEKADTNEIRKQGIKALEKAGIRIFMTQEEWKNEPEECKIGWGNPWLKKILTRDPAFRFTPPKLNDVETEIVINRAVTSMAVKMHENLIESRVGKKLKQAQKWELGKGLRIGAHKWHVKQQPSTLQEIIRKLIVEIGKGFTVEMEGERPERDACGKKIKRKKLA